jgi:hypothetical protein
MGIDLLLSRCSRGHGRQMGCMGGRHVYCCAKWGRCRTGIIYLPWDRILTDGGGLGQYLLSCFLPYTHIPPCTHTQSSVTLYPTDRHDSYPNSVWTISWPYFSLPYNYLSFVRPFPFVHHILDDQTRRRLHALLSLNAHCYTTLRHTYRFAAHRTLFGYIINKRQYPKITRASQV